MHVLIVDDEVEFLSIIKKRLERRNMQVTTAESASRCLELVEQNPESYDVIVMDVRMPGMDGLEGLALLKQKHAEIPVVLLTGHASLSVAVSGMELGAFDYLLKPVTLNELIIKLEDATNLGRVHQCDP